MSESGLLSSLNLMTLIGALVIAVLLFAYFMRKRSNRHPMDTPEGKAAEEARRREAEARKEEEGRPPLD